MFKCSFKQLPEIPFFPPFTQNFVRNISKTIFLSLQVLRKLLLSAQLDEILACCMCLYDFIARVVTNKRFMLGSGAEYQPSPCFTHTEYHLRL